MSWLLCQGMWQSQGNARGDLFPKPGFFDSDLLWVRDSCLILRAVVLVLPVPEPNGYGDLGLAWDSAWIVFSLKLMSPKAGRWLGGDGLTLPVPLGVASRDWTVKSLFLSLVLPRFFWAVWIPWDGGQRQMCSSVWTWLLNTSTMHSDLPVENVIYWEDCVLFALSTKSVCAKLGTQKTLGFSVVLGQEWFLGLRITTSGKEKNLDYIFVLS